jgi:O-antigen/teichoic acid export membrane protein
MKSKLSLVFDLFKSKHVLSLVSNGLNAVIGMTTLSILFRFLSQEDMGNWVFFLTILLLTDTFRSGFITTAFIKFYSGSEDGRKHEIVGSTWYIALSITLIFVILSIPAYFLSTFTKDLSVSLFLRFFSINYVLSLPFFVSNCVLQGQQRFDRLLFLNFANQGSFLTSLLIFIFFSHIDIYIVLYCYLFSNFLSSFLSLILGWSHIKKLKYRNKKVTKEIYNFGKFSVGTSLCANLLSSADALVIKIFLGPAVLAIYNAGTKLLQIFEIPLRSMVYTALPDLASAFNSGEKLRMLSVMKKYIGIITFALLPLSIVIFIFAESAISLLGGAKYAETEAPNILRIFVVISLLYPAERFFAVALDVVHRPKINLVKVLLMVFVTILTDWIAIVTTGNIYVVATVTIFCTLTGLLIGFYSLNRIYQRFSFLNIYVVGYHESIKILKEKYLKHPGNLKE